MFSGLAALLLSVSACSAEENGVQELVMQAKPAVQSAPPLSVAGDDGYGFDDTEDKPFVVPEGLVIPTQDWERQELPVERLLRSIQKPDAEDLPYFSMASGMPMAENLATGKVMPAYTANSGDLSRKLSALRPFAFDPLLNAATNKQPIPRHRLLKSEDAVVQSVRDLFIQQGYTLTQQDREAVQWFLGNAQYDRLATEILTDQPQDRWKLYSGVMLLKGYSLAASLVSGKIVAFKTSTGSVTAADTLFNEVIQTTTNNTLARPPAEQTPGELAARSQWAQKAQAITARYHSTLLKAGQANALAKQEYPSVYISASVYDDSWAAELVRPALQASLTLDQLSLLTAGSEMIRNELKSSTPPRKVTP